MVGRLLLGLGMCLVVSLGEDAQVNGQADEVRDKSNEVKEPRFEGLQGVTIGVLVQRANVHLEQEGRLGPPESWAFAVDGESLRWIYVDVDVSDPLADSIVVPLESPKNKIRYDGVRMLDDALAKTMGLSGPFELVQVEVNRGKGSAPSDRFVATKFVKLESALGLTIKKCLDIAQQEFSVLQDRNLQQIEMLMETARETAIGSAKPNEKTQISLTPFVSWQPKAQQLKIELVESRSNGLFQYATGTKGPELLKGVKYGTQFGVEFKGTFLFSSDGKLVEKGVGVPFAFKKTLEPPNSGG